MVFILRKRKENESNRTCFGNGQNQGEVVGPCADGLGEGRDPQHGSLSVTGRTECETDRDNGGQEAAGTGRKSAAGIIGRAAGMDHHCREGRLPDSGTIRRVGHGIDGSKENEVVPGTV